MDQSSYTEPTPTAAVQGEERLDQTPLPARYQAIFQDSPIGISYHQLLFDRNGAPADSRFLEVNPAFIRLLGLDPAGKRASQLFPGIESGSFDWLNTCNQVIVGRQSSSFEYFSPYSDRWFECVVSPLAADQFVVMLFDISSRKKVESDFQRKQREHERLLAVLDGMEAHVSVVDLEDFQILYMNHKMCRDFGGDQRGRLCFRTFQDQHQPCSFCTNPQLLKQTSPDSPDIIWEGLRPCNGRWYQNHDRIVPWVDGRMVRMQVSLDITEQKNTAIQLRRSQKMEALGVLAGGIAHDFNNILSVILGYVGMILADPEACPGPVREDLKQVEQAGIRARNLVRQILGFSRQGKEDLKPLRLEQLVKELVKMLRASFPSSIEIVTQLEPSADLILADPTQMHQLILNLCTNALHAMPEGGVLTLRLGVVEREQPELLGGTFPLGPGRYQRLEVRDSGIGMGPEVLARIFDPLFTTKEDHQGTGLGLSIVSGIAQRHKGGLEVESRLGQGTQVRVELPLCADPFPGEVQEEILSLPRGREGVLLCDDEEAIVLIWQRTLERLGYEVTAFSESPAALASFQENPGRYDLVITDMTMPMLTGMTLAKAIFALCPGQRVILCTGSFDVYDRESALAEGICAYLHKPVSSRLLAQTVRRVLDSPWPEVCP
ncbi:PAS domain-containing hybrid sensor histidine kinase/response regulator [Desulfogranum mediterraneum]|uniref:PAS domain-containing hybrid sensor histidine kinase/response regulator n=1 Tax=Desulfogranum mediterraneum TaxID=160661 RepID=UPI0004052E1E|nr:ATP-binding protein [Desulfogranum mediterraneum]